MKWLFLSLVIVGKNSPAAFTITTWKAKAKATTTGSRTGNGNDPASNSNSNHRVPLLPLPVVVGAVKTASSFQFKSHASADVEESFANHDLPMNATASQAKSMDIDIDTNIDIGIGIDPPGLQEGFVIVDYYTSQRNTTFDIANANAFDAADIDRLQLTTENITLPAALCLLRPDEYPSLSRARKACRKGSILIHRAAAAAASVSSTNTAIMTTSMTTPMLHDEHVHVHEHERVRDDPAEPPNAVQMSQQNQNPLHHHHHDHHDYYRRGRVADRIYPGDVLAKQIRQSHGSYSDYISDTTKPAFDLPVVYQDDYLAIVNKPAGVLVHHDSSGGSGSGDSGGSGRAGGSRNTIKFALPYILTPPPMDLHDRLDRPELCHRLDKPTSGLLIVAKTKGASVGMSRLFEDRQVKKTYTAILNGKLEEEESSVSSKDAHGMGIDVDPASPHRWCVAENVLDDKVAITLWRVLQYQPSLKAQNQTLTVIELKPKTGRYHQLRRQMAWMYHCPIVGDTTYGGVLDETTNKRWGRGLLLCATSVAFRHPIFEKGNMVATTNTHSVQQDDENDLLLRVSISVPQKFETFLAAERNKFHYSNMDGEEL